MTRERTVTTQAELDAALADKVPVINVKSPAGVWLTVTGDGSSSVEARGSSRVVAWESSSVVARESSSVVASGSSRVVAWGSSSVVARGSSSVEAWESSSVVAWESSSVVASKYVAIHLHSTTAIVKGGVLMDLTKLDLTNPKEWCDYHGVRVSRAGIATLYKAVNDRFTTGHGFDYSPGAKPSAPDWVDNNECGNGLHFSPTPSHAKDYNQSATRFVAVGVKAAELRPILGGTAKCKAPKVVRACVEVDIHGDVVES